MASHGPTSVVSRRRPTHPNPAALSIGTDITTRLQRNKDAGVFLRRAARAEEHLDDASPTFSVGLCRAGRPAGGADRLAGLWSEASEAQGAAAGRGDPRQ